MRRLFLGQVITTLAIAAIFLAVFTVLDEWRKPLDSRIAAMALATGGLYAAIILFRLLVKNREWDRSLDVAFAAAVCATLLPMAWLGTVIAVLGMSVASLAVMFRSLKDMPPGDMRWSWQRPYVLLWVQFQYTWVLLLWIVLGMRFP